jgi:hypothetical protein
MAETESELILNLIGSIKSNFGEVAKSTVSLPAGMSSRMITIRRTHLPHRNERLTCAWTESLYRKFRKSIEARAIASQGPKATPTNIFAKKVVNAVLKTHPPSYFTYGHFSTLFLLFYYVPRWITDRVLSVAMGVKAVEDSKKDWGHEDGKYYIFLLCWMAFTYLVFMGSNISL